MAIAAQPASALGHGSPRRFGMAWVTWRQHRAAFGTDVFTKS